MASACCDQFSMSSSNSLSASELLRLPSMRFSCFIIFTPSAQDSMTRDPVVDYYLSMKSLGQHPRNQD
jgi:hypothetical protein